MSKPPHSAPPIDGELEVLRARVAHYERAARLEARVDALLEQGLRDRAPLERMMPALLEALIEAAGARGARLRTFDESLSTRVFAGGEERGAAIEQRLDVAGQDFGAAALFVPSDLEDRAEAQDLLRIFCERIDNHLAAIAEARSRYEVIRAISDALKEPVLDHGIRRAIEALRARIDLRDLVLLFRHEDDLDAGALRYAIYRDGALAHDSADRFDPAVDALVRANAAAFLAGDDTVLRERFGITRYREEVLITGVRAARVVGRMLVTSAHGEFHTYDRELLDRFADYLRQRVVDFNREWKQLSSVFPRTTCERLLREEGYVERWLTPRDREAALLYADISGFTKVSEGVLREPDAVGRLIHTWADRAVQLVWDTGGVFDKMVGDCIIGMWGPPFFEDPAGDRCRRALDAAIRIREHTRALIHHPAVPELRALAEPLDVAIGLHYCPLSVGLFGPNENYTGFSSGMNNAARLQGVAQRGEILAMDTFVDALGEPARFGELRRASVKNVSEPLVFRALR